MKRIVFISIFFFLLICLNSIEYVPNQIIVKSVYDINDPNGQIFSDEFAQFVDSKGVKNIQTITSKLDTNYYMITLNNPVSRNEFNLIKSRSFTGIDEIQPNYLNKMLITPNDSLYNDQSNFLEMIKLPEAWNYTIGNKNILVAIIDSGIHFQHPDLQTNVYINENEIPDDGIDNDSNGFIDDWHGWDFVDAPELYDIANGDFQDPDNQPDDDLNHGTHLAGIIGGDTNNSFGISGVAWQISMLIIRAGFLTKDGLGYLQDDDAAASIIYAADMGANVINLSWGDENYSQIIADACQYAYDKGSILVASSGNTYSSNIMYPANLSTTIAVGAVDKYKDRADFSSFGPNIDVVAPGINVLSTYGELESLYFTEQSGTSVAAPFVTGAIALLLSVYPDLTINEVHSFLANSAEDLGDLGFDNEFGYGLLDVNNLLQMYNTPELYVTSPKDMESFSDNFAIEGTVDCDNFSRYSVMYSLEQDPGITDWLDVSYPHNNYPSYYNNPITDGVLAEFDINGLNPEYQQYLLKVELVTNDGFHYSEIKNIFIDLTAPVFRDSLTNLSVRYHIDQPSLYLDLAFNEPVNLNIQWPDGENVFECTHLKNFNRISLGQYYCPEPFKIIATNSTGLATTISIDPQIDPPQFNYIPSIGYEQTAIDSETIFAPGIYDINDNGFMDLFGIYNPSDNGSCRIFEYNGIDYNSLHEFPFTIWPLDMGMTDYSGIDILGLEFDNAYLYDSYGSSIFPNYVMWIEPNVFGGNFINYDSDSYDEVALIKNKTIDFVTKRVISLFNRNGLDFNEEYTLVNNSETNSRNEFSNKVCSGDFDNDDHRDILTTDKDGDVMIYEFNPDIDDFQLIWQYRLPVRNAFYLDVGDFDNDEITDFCAGGYVEDYSVAENNFSAFTFFRWSGVNNEFEIINTLYFTDVEQKNSLQTIDLDGDSDSEIIIAAPPNLYIIDYQEDHLAPIWVGNSNLNYQNVIVGVPQSESQASYFMVNSEINGEIRNTIIRKQQDLSIEPPTGFTVFPLDEESVKLDWLSVENAETYKLYRQIDNEIELIGQPSSTSFIDHGLTANDTLFYRITSVEYGTNIESYPSTWKKVIPNFIPQLETVQMINSNSIIIDYDLPLLQQSINVCNFSLDHDVGHPTSAIFRNQQNSLLLSYSNDLPYEDNYSILIKNLFGNTGVPIPNNEFTVDFLLDTETPFINDVTINKNKKSAMFKFSEEMNPTETLDIDNYQLSTPSVDTDNEIISISSVDASSYYAVCVAFKNELKHSNDGYHLQTEDLSDLAGNEMHIADRICHFNLTDIDNLDYLIIYPNPLISSKIASEDDFCFRFMNLPRNKKGKFYVYDSAGELVFEDNFGPYYNSLENYKWHIKNNNNRRISSGMYFYMIEMGGNIKKGKLAIIN